MTASANAPAAAEAAQLLAALQPLEVVRVTQGVSTWVYRIVLADRSAYLRVLPEVGSSFWPEVLAHQRLAAEGARVPQVLDWQHCEPRLGYSTMLTRALPGASVAKQTPDRLGAILEAAGRDLARVHSQPVTGFGWVERQSAPAEVLRAEHATCAAWLEAEVHEPLAVLCRHRLLTVKHIICWPGTPASGRTLLMLGARSS